MTFVVAEIGVNWDGKIELAKEMMSKAKDSGCNAVKFQAFQEETVRNHPQKKKLMKSSISKSNIDTINDISKSIGIEWFCTPMYPEAIELLDPYVKRFKIRFNDSKSILANQQTELLDKILATKKETIVSCNESPRKTKFYGNSKIKWLYVVPKYPCQLEDINFKNLKDFDGYSNHCPYLIAPLMAAILGAEIIEVHITADKSKDYLDNNVSFDFKELKSLISLIRSSKKIKTY